MTNSRSEARAERAREVLINLICSESPELRRDGVRDAVEKDMAAVSIRPSRAIRAMLAFTEPAAAMPGVPEREDLVPYLEGVRNALARRKERYPENWQVGAFAVGYDLLDYLLAALSPSHSGETGAAFPDGARSLTKLGLSHYYDAENWEATHDAADPEYAADWLTEEQGYGNGVREIATLIQGPTLFAGHYPIGWVEDSDPGDVDDWEIRFFRSHDHWRQAVERAKAAQALTPNDGGRDDASNEQREEG